MDQLLVRLEPRDVRIVEDGNAVGAVLDHAPDGLPERRRRLERQPIDEVEVDALKPELACPAVDLRRHGFGLDAVDRLLDPDVEVLDAHAHPVEAGLAEGDEMLPVQFARIDLDADFSLAVDVEQAHDRAGHVGNLVREQMRRCASAPVQLHHPAIGREQRGDHLHFTLQVRVVLFDAGAVARDHHGAAAEVAQRVAEREMIIEGEIGIHARDVGRDDFVAVVRGRERILEQRGGRIAGVPGAGTIVLLQQREINVGERTSHPLLQPGRQRTGCEITYAVPGRFARNAPQPCSTIIVGLTSTIEAIEFATRQCFSASLRSPCTTVSAPVAGTPMVGKMTIRVNR